MTFLFIFSSDDNLMAEVRTQGIGCILEVDFKELDTLNIHNMQ